MSDPTSAPPPRVPWYYSRIAVFIAIFLVAGALAIPLLLLSPAFTRKGKLVWSIVAVVYTALVVLAMVWMTEFEVDVLRNSGLF
jgi:hypothetical protein